MGQDKTSKCQDKGPNELKKGRFQKNKSRWPIQSSQNYMIL